MTGERARPRGPSIWGILGQLLPAAALCLLFVAVGVIHVTSRVMVVDAGYQLSRLEQEGRALTLTHDKLRLELAYLKSPVRLERLAREQLGMGPPPAGGVIHVLQGAPRSGRAPPPHQGGGAR